MLHSNEEILQKVLFLCKKILELDNAYVGTNQYYGDKIADLAYIARLIMADINNDCSDEGC